MIGACSCVINDNMQVRGFKEDGTITTPFNVTVMNKTDRFHFVMDTIGRLPQNGHKRVSLKQQLKDKLIEHRQCIDKNGQELSGIQNWKGCHSMALRLIDMVSWDKESRDVRVLLKQHEVLEHHHL